MERYERDLLTSSRLDCFFLVSATDADTVDIAVDGWCRCTATGRGEVARSGKGMGDSERGRAPAPRWLEGECVEGTGIRDMLSCPPHNLKAASHAFGSNTRLCWSLFVPSSRVDHFNPFSGYCSNTRGYVLYKARYKLHGDNLSHNTARIKILRNRETF